MPDHPVLFTGPATSPRRYAVTAEAVDGVATGGEGLVYRACDTDRDAVVALKLLSLVAIADYGRLVARSAPFTEIEHPNLMSHVEVFIGTALTSDTSSPDIADFDVIYAVAEWIEGDRLPDVVDSVDTVQLLGCVAGVARGLHALHHHRSRDAPQGIVHRDVKPSNVRITPNGRAVLIDFGVARPLHHGDLTQGVGTYRWRAPEVLSGSSSITTAVDVWGLGAIAYWALVGEPPGLDGAGAARERLTHSPRCRQVADPIGVAGHIATLLETDPTNRPTDLVRWGHQLDAILTRRHRSPWKRPVAATAAAVIAIPGVALLMNTSRDDPEAVATDATILSAPATTRPDTTASSVSAGLLSPAVGDLWDVTCLGEPSSMIVTGAEPGDTITLTVAYASGVAGPFERPRSAATGLDGSTGSPPGGFRLGSPEVVADGNGAFVVEWRCDRDEIGIPMVLTFGDVASSEMARVRVESRDELVGIDISIVTNTPGDEEATRLTAGVSYVLDVVAQVRDRDDDVTAKTGIAVSALNVDPLPDVTSSDPSVASVTSADDGSWTVLAHRPGTAMIDARIADTEHVATTVVTVVNPPDAPSPIDGHFEPGAVAAYLAAVLNLQVGSVESPDAAPGVTTALLPACDELPAFDTSGWSDSVRLAPPPSGRQGITIFTLTFVDSQSATDWSASLSDAHRDRVGRNCDVVAGASATFVPLDDLDPAHFVMTFDRIGDLSVRTTRNVVVIAVAGDDTPTDVRDAFAAASSTLLT